VSAEFILKVLNWPMSFIERFTTGWAGLMALVWIYFLCIAVFVAGVIIIKAIRSLPAFISWIIRRLGYGKEPPASVFLELVFPSDTTKSAFATEQLHVLLRGYSSRRKWLDKFAGTKKLYSLELVSTKDEGIRYIMVVPSEDAELISRSLLSYLPGLKIRQVSDYFEAVRGQTAAVVELKLNRDFALPLQDHKALNEHDPIAYLTGHMTGLKKDELIAIQIVTTPVFKDTHFRAIRRTIKVRHTIALGRELSPVLYKTFPGIPNVVWLILMPPVWLVIVGFKFLISIPMAIADPNDPNLPIMNSGKNYKRQTTDPYEQELSKIVKDKLSQSLYEISLRVLVVAPHGSAIQSRASDIYSAFQTFDSPYQSFGTRRSLPFKRQIDRRLTRFRERILTKHFFTQETIVSSSELSDLYHFPNTDLTKTPGLVKNRSRDLPAPLSLKHSDTELDVVMGFNSYGGEESPLGMTLPQRQKHAYIIGKTGTGKTTMLKNAIYQDMMNGKGLAVFDPHGDMFRELLEIIPKHRHKDMVIFDPSDRDYPVGLNILDPGIQFDNEDDKHEWITSTVLSVFAKITDESLWGPRMEHILRNTTLTALQTPKPSLYTLQRLLTDKKYQREVAKTLKDPVLKQFWDKEFKLLGSMQMSSATAPLTHRLGHFITSKMSRHILLQAKSTIRMADIMNEGKILLVNLSKGDIGEDQSQFFGTILTSCIWMAAYQRTKIPEKKRRDFFVYVDEFQNFATPRFSEITSEGRKFHVSLTVSHQNIAQIEDKSIVEIVAGNAGTLICLQVSPKDEAFILPYMKPEVEKGDIVNLAPYHFYMKVTNDKSEEAFSGETVPLAVEGSDKTKDSVLASSRKQYATPKKTVEKYLEKLFEEKPKKGDSKPTKTTKASKDSKGDQPKRHGA
jgi:hypothetical protein